MSELVRFTTEAGEQLVAEVDDNDPGIERVARDDDQILHASHRIDDALQQAMPSLSSISETLRRLAPDEYEVEFGVKLNAEAGVVVAKTAAEGHFTVKLVWKRGG